MREMVLLDRSIAVGSLAHRGQLGYPVGHNGAGVVCVASSQLVLLVSSHNSGVEQNYNTTTTFSSSSFSFNDQTLGAITTNNVATTTTTITWAATMDDSSLWSGSRLRKRGIFLKNYKIERAQKN